MWIQQKIILSPHSRGFHLITADITSSLPQIRNLETGLLNLFIQHTSASLTINENADPTVRSDLEAHCNKMIPENAPYYRHTYEGPDDMPAHIKASVLGSNVNIPIGRGKLLLGTWQGIYLGEHRDNASSRTIIATIQGQET